MFWLKRLPWVSLILLILTYGSFGWYISQTSEAWSVWWIEYGKSLGWDLEETLLVIILYILAAIVILLVTFGLTAPVALLTFFMGSPLKSDLRAMFSVLIWSFAVVVIICWLEYFVHFLLLICSAILARLGLQQLGCNTWQTVIIIILISLVSFILGLFLFRQIY